MLLLLLSPVSNNNTSFNGHFQDNLENRYRHATILDIIGARMMEVVVTTGAKRCAKIQSNHHHQQTNTRFFYRPDALPVAKQH